MCTCIITLIQVENVYMILYSLIYASPIIKILPKLDVNLRILNIVPNPDSAMKWPKAHLWNHAGYYLFVGPKAAKDHKYSCVCLHSDRNPQERRTNLDKFKVFLFVACFSTIQLLLNFSVITVTISDFQKFSQVLELLKIDQRFPYILLIGENVCSSKFGVINLLDFSIWFLWNRLHWFSIWK